MLLKLVSWLAQKLLVAGLIVVLALAAYGVWVYVQEERVSETLRQENLARAQALRAHLMAGRAEAERKLAALRDDITKQAQRARQAEKIIASLRELESWWEQWFGNREQQTANAERQQRLQALKNEADGKVAELQRLVTQAAVEKDGLEVALRRVDLEIAGLEEAKSRPRHYILVAWDKTKWWIALALGTYFFGPTLWAVTLYFGLAPLLARGRPIQLGGAPAALPELSASHVSVEVSLQPGEVLRIREKFLQASDEGIAKSTRFVLDWRIPFTSLACGLVELVELRHPSAAGEYRVTLSNSDDPHLELAQLVLPAGSSLVLRPSFLAGVVQKQGERLQIRRHWRVFHWQAWIGGQFRFFEFVGPCRLIVAGSRGVRAEQLAEREGQAAPARRTNQDATIGFTPNLTYRPVRAETFWSYYRGMNPLFDDLFGGQGLFVLQETASEGPAAKAGRFWSSVWNGLLKVFGL